MSKGTLANNMKTVSGPLAYDNPTTRVYNVELSDGENAELGQNVIVECMYAQCDIEGNQYRIMDHIVDHRKENNAVAKTNKMLQ